ncbi:MAG: hypothetical protein V1813_00305 [Candidatus Aenigmatarchaeota archaeon]
MDMKILTLIVLAAVLAQAAGASAQQTSDISIYLSKQTPYPAQPGDIVSIEVTIQNNGSSSQGLTLEIDPSEPFTLLPGEEKVKTFSTIGALSVVRQTYRLKVAETALSSDYDIKFLYRRPGSTTDVIKNLVVAVSGEPKIIIEDVTSVPATIEPGKEVELDVLLKNVGSGEASTMELSLATEADATTGEMLIVPVLSGGSFYMDSLLPGEEKVARFRMDIDNDAEYKSYTATLTMTYKDEGGETQTVTSNIGIPVKGSPIIEILSAKVDGTDFKVDIENIGTGTAKALKIEFVQGGEVKDSAVASDLKPAKQKTLRFTGFSYGSAMVNISYLDEGNAFYSKETPLTVKMPYTTESSGPADLTGIVGILFIAAAAEGYYIWRLRKRLKKR